MGFSFQEARNEDDGVDVAVRAAVGAAVDSALDAAVGDDEGARRRVKQLINLEANHSADSVGVAAWEDSATGGSEDAASVAKKLVFLE